jgi:hypothetical protein
MRAGGICFNFRFDGNNYWSTANGMSNFVRRYTINVHVQDAWNGLFFVRQYLQTWRQCVTLRLIPTSLLKLLKFIKNNDYKTVKTSLECQSIFFIFTSYSWDRPTGILNLSETFQHLHLLYFISKSLTSLRSLKLRVRAQLKGDRDKISANA